MLRPNLTRKVFFLFCHPDRGRRHRLGRTDRRRDRRFSLSPNGDLRLGGEGFLPEGLRFLPEGLRFLGEMVFYRKDFVFYRKDFVSWEDFVSTGRTSFPTGRTSFPTGDFVSWEKVFYRKDCESCEMGLCFCDGLRCLRGEGLLPERLRVYRKDFVSYRKDFVAWEEKVFLPETLRVLVQLGLCFCAMDFVSWEEKVFCQKHCEFWCEVGLCFCAMDFVA